MVLRNNPLLDEISNVSQHVAQGDVTRPGSIRKKNKPPAIYPQMTSVDSVRQRMLGEADAPRRQRGPVVGAATIGLLTLLLLVVVHVNLADGLPAGVRRAMQTLRPRNTAVTALREADPMFQPF